MALSGRLAVIAGGLGGLGSASGKLLLDAGANLALLYAPFEKHKAASLLDASFSAEQQKRICAYPCDIAVPEDVETAFGGIEQQLQRQDNAVFKAPSMLINSAGYVTLSNMEDTSPQETQRHLHINVMGPMLLGQAFARRYFGAAASASASHASSLAHAPPAPPGRIVNIASQAAHVALHRHGAYCASKAALLGLTRSMASEWAGRGITANSVSPTVVLTALGKKAWADDAVREAFQKRIPTKRFAFAEEIAQTVAFLCRDDAGMINGADIRVDGGFTIE